MATENPGTAAAQRRLNSWKEIGAFFGKDERTVKRWEVQRGLPVHRLPGGSRTTVYAFVDELDHWLKRSRTAGEPARPEPAPAAAAGPSLPALDPTRPWQRQRVAALASGALLLALAAGFAAWPMLRPAAVAPVSQPTAAAASPANVPAEAVDRYLAGVYHWSTRTPAGLKQALADFDNAIAGAPDYAAAYVGLANTYNLLSQYTVMPPAEAYPLAKKAAERALALDDRSADGYAALAFTTFYWLHDIGRAEALFRKSLALNPNSSQTLHWYALVTMHTGNMAEPIRAITRALELEPSARSIVANRGLILFHAGRVEEARKLLEDLEETAPDFLPPHAYLATIHLAGQQYDDYLREAREQARLEGDTAAQQNLAAAAEALRSSGPAAMLETILAAQEKQHAAGRESAFNVARTAALLGDRQKVLAWLRKSREAGEPDILGIRIDPAFRAIRTDAEFVAIADAVLPPAPARAG